MSFVYVFVLGALFYCSLGKFIVENSWTIFRFLCYFSLKVKDLSDCLPIYRSTEIVMFIKVSTQQQVCREWRRELLICNIKFRL